VCRIGGQLANHSLQDANVSVEQATDGSAQERDPDIFGKADDEHAQGGAQAADEQDGLAADAVREAAPPHAHGGLAQRKGRDEQAGVKRGILPLTDLEPLDEGPGVGEDGGQRDGFGKTDDGWSEVRKRAIHYQSDG